MPHDAPKRRDDVSKLDVDDRLILLGASIDLCEERLRMACNRPKVIDRPGTYN